MKTYHVRELTETEYQQVRAGLKDKEAFRMRRCQMVLMSAEEGLSPNALGQRLGCSGEAVRQVLRRFEAEGVGCLVARSRARHTSQRAFSSEAEAKLEHLVHQSPRQHGYARSVWTLELLAQESYAQGWTTQRVHPDTIAETLHRLGFRWKRAKRWISSPDEQYTSKKNDATGLSN